MDQLIIFTAKYLWIASVIIAVFALYKSDQRKEIFKFAAWSLPLTYILGIIARAIYNNPRPFVVENFTPLISHAADNGFPSDHVLLLAAIACMFKFFDRRIAFVLWIIALIVAAARVYAGVHHTADVIASAIISLAAAWMVYFLSKNKANASGESELQ
jgi:undecaprenyl-diphosphatase